MAQLRSWGLPYQGFGKPDQRPNRERIVDALQAFLDISDSLRQTMLESPDALDAVVCCFAGRAAVKGELEVPPPDKTEEGWISVHRKMGSSIAPREARSDVSYSDADESADRSRNDVGEAMPDRNSVRSDTEVLEPPPIPSEVASHLGYYVYLYVDPRDESVFYVGKGVRQRVLSHLSQEGESKKIRRIEDLKGLGLKPRLEILAHALKDEETAFRIEAATIDLLGLDRLTNEVRGWKSIQLGRLPLKELVIYYAAKPVEVTVPAILIRINRLYRHTMPAEELYEVTRGVWKLGRRREGAKYAFAVFEGVVRAVYAIDSWHPAWTTNYEIRPRTPHDRDPGRWEFLGRLAPEDIASKYLDRSVRTYFRQGQQSPVVYVNC